jgi:hypothetical protein
MAARPTVVIELAAGAQTARDLAAGGVFAPGCALELSTECDLVVRGAAGELRVGARVVFLDPRGGAGLELIGFGPEMKAQLAALAAPAAEAEAGPEAETAAEAEGDSPQLRERLRQLPLAQQIKRAHSGDLQERIVLERMYGKNVWESLLRNPRLTAPEVARIARMAALPRSLIEIILGNGAWLQIGEVRRALLNNPRLAIDQILRVLRLLSKPELKIVSVQASYPFQVRDAAKRMLREAP